MLTVNLTKHGEIRLDRAQIAFGDKMFLAALKRDGLKPDLRSLSLDEFGGFLSQAKRSYHLKQRFKGKSGYDQVAPGVKACGLTLDIRADRDAPLRHVLLLMIICAEEKYYKLRLAALRPDGSTGFINARLPTDKRIAPLKPVRKKHVAVSLLATKEKEAQWGRPGETTKAQVATAVTCSYARESFDWGSAWAKPAGRAALATWLQAMKRDKEGSPVVVGHVLASEKVPVQQFASLLTLFRSQGYALIDFFGVAIPTREERKAKRLAYPVNNELPERVYWGAEPEPHIPEPDDD